MKKLSIAFVAIVVAIMASCGNGTPKANLKNDIDTLSYAIGMAQSTGLRGYLVNRMGVDTAYIDEFIKGLNDGANAGDDKKRTAYYAGLQIGQQVSQQLVKGVNYELFGEDSTQTINLRNFLAGFISGTTEKGGLMTQDEAQDIAQQKMTEIKREQLEKVYGDWRRENEAFLQNIAKQDGVKQLTDGVYYSIITEGTGEIPSDTSRVEVDYEGRLINDTVFDSSYKRGEATKVRCNQLIAGWTDALTHMPVGSKWTVYISADKGYGERQAGEIKPFSTLIFTMELKSVVR
ncbi:MAG: FKBP-type peptidyl-prolyl cis-trans isomerase [Prevotellaceae bacterium]|nr:FKBP-type peptidyl-prolyl cis-trans isomerase [Prevotellaceae bacterium]MCD8304460.1 FKBP-type peptidyl-prolyl cis-trans isomerase [Prevotellaceae bacterium]